MITKKATCLTRKLSDYKKTTCLTRKLSVLGPLLFLLYIADLPRLLQNELVGYADDSTLLCRIPHPRDRSSVAASLNDDLAVISDWCSRWDMLVNPSKTRGMLISRSRTVEPLFPDLLIDVSVVEMVSELKILGVIFDSKLTFEKQVRVIAASASMRVDILRKTMSVFRDVTVVAKCFWVFIFPVLEYCSPVWMFVVALSCCQPSWPIKQWKCQLRSLAQEQSGISECLLQD